LSSKLGSAASLSLIASLALTGCTDQSEPDVAAVTSAVRSPSATAPDRAQSPAAATHRLWSKSTLKPLSGVANIAGVAVTYTKRGRSIFITAMNPRSGRVLWQDEASPSAAPRAMLLSVTALGMSNVAYYRYENWTDNAVVSLVIADARTGNVLTEGDPQTYYLPVDACDDNAHVACAQTWDRERKVFVVERFSPGIKLSVVVRVGIVF
jgi:hypothetical protein